MNYEQAIKEARTIEAMKNGYIGMGGKFSQITKKLGHPIIKQGGIYVDSSYFEDINEDVNEIKSMEEDESTFEIGRQFDGLSRGMNISIIVFYHLAEITVTFEGKKVYKETSGELEMYVPDPDWEECIDKLCGLTKKIEKSNKVELNKKKKEVESLKKKSILDQLKKKWGI